MNLNGKYGMNSVVALCVVKQVLNFSKDKNLASD